MCTGIGETTWRGAAMTTWRGAATTTWRGATTTCTARAVFGASGRGEISIRRGRRQPRERPTRREGLDDAGFCGRVGGRVCGAGGGRRMALAGEAFSRFWSNWRVGRGVGR